MKRLLVLLLFPTLCVAQKIPTRANTIIISFTTKAQMRDALIEKGFTVVDHDGASFETLPRQYKEIENGSLIIKAQRKDSLIMLTGMFNQIAYQTAFNPYGNKWKPAIRTALEGNSREAFEIIRHFAESLPCKITYAKL